MTRECHVRFCERLRGKFLRATRQFFLGFAGYSIKAPFDPSMMVHFRKRFSEIELNRINELIAARGKAMVMEAVASLPDNDEPDDPDAGSGKQISLDDLVKSADWPEDKNWGILSIDASCTPADITRGLRDLAIDDQGMAVVHEQMLPVARLGRVGIGLTGQ